MNASNVTYKYSTCIKYYPFLNGEKDFQIVNAPE